MEIKWQNYINIVPCNREYYMFSWDFSLSCKFSFYLLFIAVTCFLISPITNKGSGEHPVLSLLVREFDVENCYLQKLWHFI